MSITQTSVFIESKPGHLTRTLEVFAKHSINVRGFSAADTGEYGIVRFIVDEPDRAEDLLCKEGFAVQSSQVLCVKLADNPGELQRVLKIFADHDINIVYCYSLASSYIALSVKDIERAEKALEDAPVTLVEQEEIVELDLS